MSHFNLNDIDTTSPPGSPAGDADDSDSQNVSSASIPRVGSARRGTMAYGSGNLAMALSAKPDDADDEEELSTEGGDDDENSNPEVQQQQQQEQRQAPPSVTRVRGHMIQLDEDDDDASSTTTTSSDDGDESSQGEDVEIRPAPLTAEKSRPLDVTPAENYLDPGEAAHDDHDARGHSGPLMIAPTSGGMPRDESSFGDTFTVGAGRNPRRSGHPLIITPAAESLGGPNSVTAAGAGNRPIDVTPQVLADITPAANDGLGRPDGGGGGWDVTPAAADSGLGQQPKTWDVTPAAPTMTGASDSLASYPEMSPLNPGGSVTASRGQPLDITPAVVDISPDTPQAALLPPRPPGKPLDVTPAVMDISPASPGGGLQPPRGGGRPLDVTPAALDITPAVGGLQQQQQPRGGKPLDVTPATVMISPPTPQQALLPPRGGGRPLDVTPAALDITPAAGGLQQPRGGKPLDITPAAESLGRPNSVSAAAGHGRPLDVTPAALDITPAAGGLQQQHQQSRGGKPLDITPAAESLGQPNSVSAAAGHGRPLDVTPAAVMISPPTPQQALLPPRAGGQPLDVTPAALDITPAVGGLQQQQQQQQPRGGQPLDVTPAALDITPAVDGLQQQQHHQQQQQQPRGKPLDVTPAALDITPAAGGLPPRAVHGRPLIITPQATSLDAPASHGYGYDYDQPLVAEESRPIDVIPAMPDISPAGAGDSISSYPPVMTPLDVEGYSSSTKNVIGSGYTISQPVALRSNPTAAFRDDESESELSEQQQQQQQFDVTPGASITSFPGGSAESDAALVPAKSRPFDACVTPQNVDLSPQEKRQQQSRVFDQVVTPQNVDLSPMTPDVVGSQRPTSVAAAAEQQQRSRAFAELVTPQAVDIEVDRRPRTVSAAGAQSQHRPFDQLVTPQAADIEVDRRPRTVAASGARSQHRTFDQLVTPQAADIEIGKATSVSAAGAQRQQQQQQQQQQQSHAFNQLVTPQANDVSPLTPEGEEMLISLEPGSGSPGYPDDLSRSHDSSKAATGIDEPLRQSPPLPVVRPTPEGSPVPARRGSSGSSASSSVSRSHDSSRAATGMDEPLQRHSPAQPVVRATPDGSPVVRRGSKTSSSSDSDAETAAAASRAASASGRRSSSSHRRQMMGIRAVGTAVSQQQQAAAAVAQEPARVHDEEEELDEKQQQQQQQQHHEQPPHAGLETMPPTPTTTDTAAYAKRSLPQLRRAFRVAVWAVRLALRWGAATLLPWVPSDARKLPTSPHKPGWETLAAFLNQHPDWERATVARFVLRKLASGAFLSANFRDVASVSLTAQQSSSLFFAPLSADASDDSSNSNIVIDETSTTAGDATITLLCNALLRAAATLRARRHDGTAFDALDCGPLLDFIAGLRNVLCAAPPAAFRYLPQVSDTLCTLLCSSSSAAERGALAGPVFELLDEQFQLMVHHGGFTLQFVEEFLLMSNNNKTKRPHLPTHVARRFLLLATEVVEKQNQQQCSSDSLQQIVQRTVAWSTRVMSLAATSSAPISGVDELAEAVTGLVGAALRVEMSDQQQQQQQQLRLTDETLALLFDFACGGYFVHLDGRLLALVMDLLDDSAAGASASSSARRLAKMATRCVGHGGGDSSNTAASDVFNSLLRHRSAAKTMDPFGFMSALLRLAIHLDNKPLFERALDALLSNGAARSSKDYAESATACLGAARKTVLGVVGDSQRVNTWFFVSALAQAHLRLQREGVVKSTGRDVGEWAHELLQKLQVMMSSSNDDGDINIPAAISSLVEILSLFASEQDDLAVSPKLLWWILSQQQQHESLERVVSLLEQNINTWLCVEAAPGLLALMQSNINNSESLFLRLCGETLQPRLLPEGGEERKLAELEVSLVLLRCAVALQSSPRARAEAMVRLLVSASSNDDNTVRFPQEQQCADLALAAWKLSPVEQEEQAEGDGQVMALLGKVMSQRLSKEALAVMGSNDQQVPTRADFARVYSSLNEGKEPSGELAAAQEQQQQQQDRGVPASSSSSSSVSIDQLLALLDSLEAHQRAVIESDYDDDSDRLAGAYVFDSTEVVEREDEAEKKRIAAEEQRQSSLVLALWNVEQDEDRARSSLMAMAGFEDAQQQHDQDQEQPVADSTAAASGGSFAALLATVAHSTMPRDDQSLERHRQLVAALDAQHLFLVELEARCRAEHIESSEAALVNRLKAVERAQRNALLERIQHDSHLDSATKDLQHQIRILEQERREIMAKRRVTDAGRALFKEEIDKETAPLKAAIAQLEQQLKEERARGEKERTQSRKEKEAAGKALAQSKSDSALAQKQLQDARYREVALAGDNKKAQAALVEANRTVADLQRDLEHSATSQGLRSWCHDATTELLDQTRRAVQAEENCAAAVEQSHHLLNEFNKQVPVLLALEKEVAFLMEAQKIVSIGKLDTTQAQPLAWEARQRFVRVGADLGEQQQSRNNGNLQPTPPVAGHKQHHSRRRGQQQNQFERQEAANAAVRAHEHQRLSDNAAAAAAADDDDYDDNEPNNNNGKNGCCRIENSSRISFTPSASPVSQQRRRDWYNRRRHKDSDSELSLLEPGAAAAARSPAYWANNPSTFRKGELGDEDLKKIHRVSSARAGGRPPGDQFRHSFDAASSSKRSMSPRQRRMLTNPIPVVGPFSEASRSPSLRQRAQSPGSAWKMMA